jgi:hypothetical protein
VTDVASGWTETQAVINKAQVWVFEALQLIRGRLPSRFPLRRDIRFRESAISTAGTLIIASLL